MIFILLSNKRLPLLFVLSFLFLGTNAQNINIGASAGANATQATGDGYGGFNKAGIIVGGYANFNLSQKVNLQFEINYSEKGSRRNPKTDEGDTDFFLFRTNYIEIPLMARLENNRFTYEVGLYYGQLINSYLEDENGIFEIPPETNQLKDSDIGGLVGINFNFTEHLIMNWRYSTSILPVRDFDSGASFRFKSGILHHVVSFTLRYEFTGRNE